MGASTSTIVRQPEASPAGGRTTPGLRSFWNAALPSVRQYGTSLFGVATILLTLWGVFLLPFSFPPGRLTLSAAYTCGYNNRVGVVAAAMCSLFVLLVTFVTKSGTPQVYRDDRSPVSPWIAGATLVLCAGVTLGCGWILIKASVIYNDNLYFIEFLDQIWTYHRQIYQDFSFNYGPLLLYLPLAVEAALAPLHLGVEHAYFVTLALMHLIGLLLLSFTLQALPISGRLRTLSFLVLALAAFSPNFGMNYTLVRALLPFSTLLFLTRFERPWTFALAAAAGEMLQLAVSPELGFTFLGGVCCYAVFRSVPGRRLFFLTILAPLSAVALFLANSNPHYLDSVKEFGSGALNFVVQPLPYILFFLFCLVWLVPRMIAMRLRDRSPDAIPLLSLFVVCLGSAPVALGRSDPLHVLYNGVGLYLLAAVAIDSCSRRFQSFWLITAGWIVLWSQSVNLTLYSRAFAYAADTIHELRSSTSPRNPLLEELAPIERIARNSTISVPFMVVFGVEQELKRTHQYQPDPYCFGIGITDPAAETARIARMNATQWALLSTSAAPAKENTETMAADLGIGFVYPEVKSPYLFGALTYKELVEHWKPIYSSNTWVLYHNNRFPRETGEAPSK